MLELVPPEPVQEVGLVLLGVARPQQPRLSAGIDLTPGVVAGRDGLALVEVARPTEQRPELHVRVAVDTGARRPTVEVRRQERLDDAGIELPLEIQHVERDPELGRDAPGVVGRVERAAALLELRVRVGDVVEAHPDPDDLVALFAEECRRDGRVDPARHRDEDPGHAGTPCPIGSAATAAAPIRIEAMTDGMIPAASSISASVVVRPRVSRSAPRASSSG